MDIYDDMGGKDPKDTFQMKPGQKLEYFTQEHRTDRNPNRTHYDFRMGRPDRGLASWAIPKSKFPDVGEKLLAVQTPLHNYDYGAFSGVLNGGYGSGKVRLVEKGMSEIHTVAPDHISFTLYRNKIPTKYTLLRSKRKPGEWIILGVDPRKDISQQTIQVKKVKGNDKQPSVGRLPIDEST